MKILLINPPMDFRKSEESKKKAWVIYPPGGLLYLGTILNNENFEIKILDLIAKEFTIEETENFIKSFNPYLIGITSTTPQIRGAVDLAKLIKKINKQRTKFNKIISVLGGPHISADPNFFYRKNYFDYAICGEGEISFLELLNNLKNRKKIEKKLIIGKNLNDLNSVGFLNLDLIEKKDYYISPFGSDFITLHTSRGCPFNCIYCSNPVGKKNIRYKDYKKVVDEIEFDMKKYSVKYILFTDDTFTLDKERTKKLCLEMIKRKIKILWSCETRANLLDEELVKLMKQCGCIEIAFGVESGSEKLRQDIIHKGVTDKEIIKAFALCKKYNIETAAFCMLGFPGETKEDMYKTLKFVLKITPDLVGLHLTVPMPGSQIYNQAIDEKVMSRDYWDKYAEGDIKEQPIYIPKNFTLKELKQIQKDIYKKYYFRPIYLYRRFIKSIKSPRRLLTDISAAIQLLKIGGTSSGRV